MSGTARSLVDAGGRECVKCGEYKTWDNFQKHPSGLNGKMARCRPCKTQDKYDWIARNPERHSDYTQAYRASGAFAEASKRHYWKDPDRSRARLSEYRSRDPERTRERDRDYAKRRRYAKVTTGVFPAKEWRRLLNRFRGLCAYCQEAPAQHREHVIPVSRGGTNTVGNILPACASCNYSKHVLTLMEWRLSGRAPAAMKPINRRSKCRRTLVTTRAASSRPPPPSSTPSSPASRSRGSASPPRASSARPAPAPASATPDRASTERRPGAIPVALRRRSHGRRVGV